MRTIIKISFITIIATAISLAADSTSPDLREYVCTNRFFELPESFDAANPNLEECRRLVKANPNRFESHLIMATALARAGRLEEAVEEFRTVDELSSKVKDREVLASLPYEDFYAFALVAAADKRMKQNTNDVSMLRMLQQAIGMDVSELRKNKRLAQCYMMMGSLYLKRGLYDKVIEVAEIGIKTAKLEDHPDFIHLFEEMIAKAKDFKNRRSQREGI